MREIKFMTTESWYYPKHLKRALIGLWNTIQLSILFGSRAVIIKPQKDTLFQLVHRKMSVVNSQLIN